MTEPFNRGAFARAVIAAFCLFLIQALVVAPHAQAAARHHHHNWGHCHARYGHHRRAWLACHRHRAHFAINTRTGAVEPGSDPLAFMGSLFQPPAPPILTFDHQVLRPFRQAAEIVAATAASYGHRGYAAVAAAARHMGIPIALGLAEAKQESGGNCAARSHTDARGVLQVEPYTALKDGFNPRLLYDCDYGAIAGLTELKHLIEADGGITCHAVSRYYGSDAYLRRFRGGCAPYGRQVLARMRAIERSPNFEASIMQAEWPVPHRRTHHRWSA